jgi:peptide/nickel transport system substrate-binding protein
MGIQKKSAMTAGIAAAAAVLVLLSLTAPSLNSQDEATILRIGTTDPVKSANILLDPGLSLFAHISNPTLMKMSREVRPGVRLLREIGHSPDLKSWILTLRDDLHWSDGRTVTSADIRFTFYYLRDRFPAAGWFKAMLEDITTPDRLTAVIRLKKPYARLDFELLTYPLLPGHVWEKIEEPLRHTDPGPIVGCGPFVIGRTDLNRGVISFVRNPHWKGDAPHIDGVEIHLYKNRDILALALQRGDIDIFYEYASSYPYANLAALRRQGGFGFLEQLNLGLHFLGFNLKREPMSDIGFRKALAFAIDYDEIIRLITLGNARVPQWGFVPPSMPEHTPTQPCVFDARKAGRMLDSAGYKDADGDGIREGRDGRGLRLTLLADPLKPFNNRLSELLVEYLAAVGVRIQVRAVEGGSWMSLKDKYRYDLLLSRSSPWGMLMHASWATGYFDARRTGEGVLHTVDDPSFLEMCDALLATTGPGEVRRLAHGVQDYYARNLPAVPLFWNTIVTPYNTRFSGWILDPLYGLYNIDSLLNVRRRRP